MARSAGSTRKRAPGEGKASRRAGGARPERARPRAGTVALVGRPNVGKSTLLNALLGERIAITSHHPQTTRDRIAGILTVDRTQYVLLDTPGLHKPRNRLGQRMNDVASGTAAEADAVLFLVDVDPDPAPEVREEDERAFRSVPPGKPVVLVVNKVDRVKQKTKLLEVLAAYAKLYDFAAVVPISAKKRDGLDRLLAELGKLLPEGEPLYPEDDLSDKPVRFFVAELVREQILLRTRQEVPHGVAVTVDAFEEGKKLSRVALTVHVAKESHKGIVIGQGGKMLAAIGTAARERAERLLGQRLHLDIRVKATPGWFDDAGKLIELGYADDGLPPKNDSSRARARAGAAR